jgi:hypothetical protein
MSTMPDMTDFDVILTRSWGLDLDGVYVYCAVQLPDEGATIVVTSKHTGRPLSATVTKVVPDGRFPIYANEM